MIFWMRKSAVLRFKSRVLAVLVEWRKKQLHPAIETAQKGRYLLLEPSMMVFFGNQAFLNLMLF
jgi:hypothetical protein